jgi:hypothetical protein
LVEPAVHLLVVELGAELAELLDEAAAEPL